jgi:lipopolysaccharide transport system ATP-binding protein
LSELAIKVENLSKSYRIGATTSYKTLRESLVNVVSASFRHSHITLSDETGWKQKHIWALKDVSFEVKRGQAVGIIGANGSGKSTLLKILSRITRPTEGRAMIFGRVSSLLEVGTGFHPELTGRENIQLNAAVLGMPKAEVIRKFDSIVDFAGDTVKKFIDTPVKRYSSGMYVRLAFAIAAHIDPDVLLVDEVLAVGDAAFQEKCLNKMEEVASSGKTVILVSHNVTAITSLCDTVILLDEGKVYSIGPPAKTVQEYLKPGTITPSERVWQDINTAPGDDIAKIRAVRVCNEKYELVEKTDIQKSIGVQIEYWNLKPNVHIWPLFHFKNREGLFLFVSADHEYERIPQPVGLYKRTCWIPGNYLAEGGVVISAFISTLDPPTSHAWMHEAVMFDVVDNSQGDGVRGKFVGSWPGVVRPLLRWTGEDNPEEVE